MTNEKIKIKRRIPKNEIQGQKAEKYHQKSAETTNESSHILGENNKIFITCQAGVEALVKRDNEKLGIKITETQDRIVRACATESQIYDALIWNRFANRIYLEICTSSVNTFDELFDSVEAIDWKKYLPKGIAIVTEATAIKSQLSHTPTIQSIAKKAIVKQLTSGTGTHHLFEDRQGKEAHIQIFIIKNIAYILLDITGEALHKRGWRTEAGEAPIKETLAAAILVFSGWKFTDVLLDPFCGSGTIAIEAAMMARNIAPGISRHFAIEYFPFLNKNLMITAQKNAKSRIYASGKYKIFAKDIDAIMIEKARRNAVRAGVAEDIVFEVGDFFDTMSDQKMTIVTNPPYGLRLENASDEDFYKNFVNKLEHPNFCGGFITSYDFSSDVLNKKYWKDRKLYNGGLLARFYKKI